MSARRSVRAIIRGRVQGVGFRAFVERNAVEHGVEGWVRNRADGAVEATLSGAAPAVEALLEACRAGPPGAGVEGIELREENAAGLVPASRPSGFLILPTV